MVPWLIRPPRSLLATAVFALLGMVVPGAARADFVSPITFEGANTGSGGGAQVLTIDFNSQSMTGYVGQYLMQDANGTKFNAFCVDLSHSMPSTSYPVVSTTLPPYVAAPVGNQMAFLVNSYVNSPSAAQAYLASQGLTATTNQAEAAVQMAIWTDEYGSKFSYDPSNSQNSSGPSTADVNAFISQTSGDTTSVATVLEATPTDSNPTQGQSVATSGGVGGPPAVPEPSSAVLLGMGLLGLGAFRRRGCLSARSAGATA